MHIKVLASVFALWQTQEHVYGSDGINSSNQMIFLAQNQFRSRISQSATNQKLMGYKIVTAENATQK